MDYQCLWEGEHTNNIVSEQNKKKYDKMYKISQRKLIEREKIVTFVDKKLKT